MTRARARSGRVDGVVDDGDVVFAVVLGVGAGLVGGMGGGDTVLVDDPPLHVARTSAPTTTHERRTPCSV